MSEPRAAHARRRRSPDWLAMLPTVCLLLALGAGAAGAASSKTAAGPTLDMSYVRAAVGPDGVKDWVPVKAGINASYLWVRFSPDYFRIELAQDDIPGPKSPDCHVPYLMVTVSSFGPAMTYDGKSVSSIPMVFRGEWNVVPDKSQPKAKPRWVFTPSEPANQDSQFVTYDPKGSLLSPPLRLVDAKVRISVKLKDAYVDNTEHKSFLDHITGALGFVTSIVTGCGPAFKSLGLFTSSRSTDRIGAVKSVVDFFGKQQPANTNQKESTLIQMNDIRWLPGDEQLPNGDLTPVPHHIILAPTAALKAAGVTDSFASLEPVKALMDSPTPAPVMVLTFDPVETLLPNTVSSILNDLDNGDGLRKAFRGIRAAAQKRDTAKLQSLRTAAQMEAEARVDSGKFLDREVDTVDDAFVVEVTNRMGSASEAAQVLGMTEAAVMVAHKRSRPTSDSAVTTQLAKLEEQAPEVRRALGGTDDGTLKAQGVGDEVPSWDRMKTVLDISDPQKQVDREAVEVLYWLSQAGIKDPDSEMRLRPFEARKFAAEFAHKQGKEVSFSAP